MNKKKVLILIAVLLILVAAVTALFLGYRKHYDNTHVFIEDAVYPADATFLDLRGTGISIEHYEALRQALPECEITWDVPFQGSFLPCDTTQIAVKTLSDEDILTLDYFPQLQKVDATGCVDYPQIMALGQRRPECQVTWQVTLNGESYPWDVQTLSLPAGDAAQLQQALAWLPELKQVSMDLPTMAAEDLLALVEAYPNVEFKWNAQVMGVTYPSDTTALDFSGIELTDIDALEAELAYLPALETVEVHHCGVDSETLAAWRQRQADNYKVIWTVNLGWGLDIRTDVKTFMPVILTEGGTVHEKYLTELKYCNELICVDVGHMPITHCDWAAYMPELKYLIVGDTGIKSIEGLRGLENLIYFEAFTTPLKDLSPLLDVPNLKDLNIVNTYGDPQIVAQLTSLERLWWGGFFNVNLSKEDQAMIKAALPNTECMLHVMNPTSLGWRKGKLYYEMRDVLGMPYFGQ